MVKGDNKKLGSLLLWVNGLVLAIILNQVGSLYFFRLDLTEEKRYTIRQPTLDLLKSLEDDVYVEVYLEGDLNAPFRRLRKAVQETLEEFRVYSHNKIHYRFSDPAMAQGQNAQREFMTALAAKGIQPMNVIDKKDGQRTEKLVFPGALISYSGAETGVMLLKSKWAQNSEAALNQSIEGLEFELSNAINKLSAINRKQIGLVSGHGELDSAQMASLNSALLESYDLAKIDLARKQPLDAFAVLVVAKPTGSFSEREKFALDQYLLGGGRILFFIDPLEATMDSASRENYHAFPYRIGLEDQLFRYGVRINQDLVQDIVCLRYPVITGNLGGKPQVTPLEWPFFPLVNHYADHPITRNLDASVLKFVSSIDSVKAPGIRKTPLLFSSAYSRKIAAPVKIDVNDLRKEMKPQNFSNGPLAVAYLLEGKFTSVYKNRFLPEGVDSTGFRAEGAEAKVIVVADGDVARNEVNPRAGEPLALGFDSFSGRTFGNQELILNMIAYLADESGLINARSKEVKIRPLDKEKIRNSRVLWQTVNLGLPIVVIVLFGIVKNYLRKRKYGSFDIAMK